MVEQYMTRRERREAEKRAAEARKLLDEQAPEEAPEASTTPTAQEAPSQPAEKPEPPKEEGPPQFASRAERKAWMREHGHTPQVVDDTDLTLRRQTESETATPETPQSTERPRAVAPARTPEPEPRTVQEPPAAPEPRTAPEPQEKPRPATPAPAVTTPAPSVSSPKAEAPTTEAPTTSATTETQAPAPSTSAKKPAPAKPEQAPAAKAPVTRTTPAKPDKAPVWKAQPADTQKPAPAPREDTQKTPAQDKTPTQEKTPQARPRKAPVVKPPHTEGIRVVSGAIPVVKPEDKEASKNATDDLGKTGSHDAHGADQVRTKAAAPATRPLEAVDEDSDVTREEWPRPDLDGTGPVQPMSARSVTHQDGEILVGERSSIVPYIILGIGGLCAIVLVVIALFMLF